jgi:hypothetical protein
MALPTTGGTWAQELEPNLNPLNVRYSQVTHAIIRDYDPTGVFNLAAPSVGLAQVYTANATTANLFSPFPSNNTSIRSDLFASSSGTNQGFYDVGLLKEDAQDWTLDQTLTETPSAQFVRTVRNIITKLDDKVMLVPIESSPVTDFLRYELPLASGVPTLGTAGYGLARANTDVGVERILILISIDTNANMWARVFPRVITDKKGKSAAQRKEADAMPLSYSVLPDPFSGQSMWVCRAGSAWLGAGNLDFETLAPLVTPITGLKANITFQTPIDVTTPVYSISTQLTATSAFVSGSLTSTSGTVSGGFTTIQATSLTASTTYNAVQVTATGSNATVTGPVSAPFTSTAS